MKKSVKKFKKCKKNVTKFAKYMKECKKQTIGK